MINRQEINELIDESKDYIEARLDLIKLKLAEQSSEAFSKLMAAFILAGFFLIFLIAFSFFMGMTLSVLWENYIAGFGAVALFYLIVFAILLFNRKKLLEVPIQNTAIRNIFKDEETDSN
ncbi:MAG: phage holin family protein [Vicingaceae bacterium]